MAAARSAVVCVLRAVIMTARCCQNRYRALLCFIILVRVIKNNKHDPLLKCAVDNSQMGSPSLIVLVELIVVGAIIGCWVILTSRVPYGRADFDTVDPIVLTLNRSIIDVSRHVSFEKWRQYYHNYKLNGTRVGKSTEFQKAEIQKAKNVIHQKSNCRN